MVSSSLINPFSPTRYAEETTFAGRKNEIESIRACIRQTANGMAQNFIITGEKGIGKSSLLMNIHRWAGSGEKSGKQYRILPLLVTLDSEDDVNSIVGKIKRQLMLSFKKHNPVFYWTKRAWDFVWMFKFLGVEKKDRESTSSANWVALDRLSESLQNESMARARWSLIGSFDGIALFFDEAERVKDDAKFGGMLRRLTEQLQKDGAGNAMLGVVGQPSVFKQIRKDHGSTLRNFSQIPLNPLSREDCLELIAKGESSCEVLNSQRVDFDESAKNWIVQNSGGYPHFVQMFCSKAFDHRKGDVITEADVWESAYAPDHGALAQIGESFFYDITDPDQLSDNARLVLRALAKGNERFTERARLESFLGNDMSKEDIDEQLKALRSMEKIEHNPNDSSLIRLKNRTLAHWLNLYYSNKN